SVTRIRHRRLVAPVSKYVTERVCVYVGDQRIELGTGTLQCNGQRRVVLKACERAIGGAPRHERVEPSTQVCGVSGQRLEREGRALHSAAGVSDRGPGQAQAL